MKLVDLLKVYAGKQDRASIPTSPFKAEGSRGHEGYLPTDLTDWPAEYLEAFEERAAIMEHDGRMDRHEAERRAEELQRKAYSRLLNIEMQ